MTDTILIAFCSLLLIAYFFDFTSAKTKIPSAILLIALGLAIKEISVYLGYPLKDITTLLPVLATIGLILIVLEGSLELEINSSKIKLIKKTILGAFIPMVILSFILALAFNYFGNYPLKTGILNAIPLAILSSAIAIPSVRHLGRRKKEFVIYETSFSDILGILFFNFFAYNETIGFDSVGVFVFHLIIMIVISIIATIGLSLLLSRINHHIKFVPIILLIVLLYSVLKIYHLPALLFILLFGLAIENLDQFNEIRWIKKFNTDNLKNEIKRFKEITIEGTFLIRALFFILFGYMIKISEITNLETIGWAVAVVAIAMVIRVFQLKLSGFSLNPLLYIAPRGLITILLFLSIEPEMNISFVNNSLIIQVILITSIMMTFALMARTSKKN
jgi:potassium/hydrogen antiporter